jgi:hypothetical protein
VNIRTGQEVVASDEAVAVVAAATVDRAVWAAIVFAPIAATR